MLDVGLRSSPIDEYDTLTTSDLLAFAEIEPAHIRAIPLERHIAEKLHAYTRRYGNDRPSSRAKDLIDIVIMSELAPFAFDQLREVIVRLFDSRAAHELPASVPAAPSEWARPYRALAEEVGLDPDLIVGHHRAAAFLDPILATEPDRGHWEVGARTWRKS